MAPTQSKPADGGAPTSKAAGSFAAQPPWAGYDYGRVAAPKAAGRADGGPYGKGAGAPPGKAAGPSLVEAWSFLNLGSNV